MDIDEYDAAERKARTALCNREIQAFAPKGFDQVGYPSRIDSMSEI